MTTADHPDGPPVVIDQLQLNLDGIEPLSEAERIETWFREQTEDSPDSRAAALFLRDRRTRRARAARWEQIQNIQAPFASDGGWLIPGGIESVWLYEEAQRAYVEGMPLASLLCAHAACERVLAGCLLGYDDELPDGWRLRWGLGKLVNATFDRDLIDEPLRDDLIRVSEIRRVSAHFKPPDEPESLLIRAWERRQGVPDLDHYDALDQIAQDDALLAIRAATELMRGDQGLARARW